MPRWIGASCLCGQLARSMQGGEARGHSAGGHRADALWHGARSVAVIADGFPCQPEAGDCQSADGDSKDCGNRVLRQIGRCGDSQQQAGDSVQEIYRDKKGLHGISFR